VKLLCFQAERFRWTSFSKTLDEATDETVDETVTEAVVIFLHAEAPDFVDAEAYRRTFKQTLKHIKWLANKRNLTNVVLHSFTHLGGANADAHAARDFIDELAERLRSTDYAVWTTPFGWFCSWELAVYGESLAKVWKEI
jgi:hypothetical protein